MSDYFFHIRRLALLPGVLAAMWASASMAGPGVFCRDSLPVAGESGQVFPVQVSLPKQASAMGSTVQPAHSVLADGSWYKLAVPAMGVYKIDLTLLSSLGISTTGLSTASIQLFGSGGRMLPEATATPRYADLPEVALQAADGGDGVLNGSDYLAFYAPGPHAWLYDAGSKTFSHQYNLYSDTAYYFLHLGTAGSRMTTDNTPVAAVAPLTTYNYLDFFEKDSLNFLHSGKQWFGAAFGSAAGQQMAGVVRFELPGAPVNGQVLLNVRLAARCFDYSSFGITLNGSQVGVVNMNPVSGNIFEAYATATATGFTASLQQGDASVGLQFGGGNNALGWLDYLEIQAMCPLTLPTKGALVFRNNAAIGQQRTLNLAQSDASTQVWNVTDILHPVQMNTRLQAGTLAFSDNATTLQEYMAFRPADLQTPIAMGIVPNQDLHGIGAANLMIITVPALAEAAHQLAAYHSAHDGLTTQVVHVGDLYTEFASGNPDPTAIRDFLKMLYDRGAAPQYLLLLGAASYDYKRRNPGNDNLVPSYESDASLDPVNSYVSDDYYGLLDDNADISQTNTGTPMRLAIGRLPARSPDDATAVVQKITGYLSPDNFGPWRNGITFTADDGDDNLHLQNADALADTVGAKDAQLNIDKIYLDAYAKQSGAGGSRYPDVNDAIAAGIYKGTLIWNYTGHGNYSRLAEEDVLDQASVDAWDNAHRLPLLITATCDFAPFDNPDYLSLGEYLVLKPKGGAIALMTTTRAVYAYANQTINLSYLEAALTPGPTGNLPSLGNALMYAKNSVYNNFGDIINSRKFQLLGDPALTLAYPALRVVTDSIRQQGAGGVADTLMALGQYQVAGHIADAAGVLQSSYMGELVITVYDKPARMVTRGNDAGSTPATYNLQHNILYKGKQTVSNGRFTFTFAVPQDIDYQAGSGKISYYISNATLDGGGFYHQFQVGGTAPLADTDHTGPVIRLFMNTTAFRDGDLTGQNPVLLADLQDLHGINLTGTGVGHDIVAVLDDSTTFFVLNDFYEAALDSAGAGSIRFPLSGLSTGPHTLTVKAWDTYNNSSTAVVHFVVMTNTTLAAEKVYNYPNPFHDQTRFVFEHNQEGGNLGISVIVYAIDGRRVKKIIYTINAAGSRFDGVQWDGRGENGAKLPPGLYFYNVIVDNGRQQRALGGKLILL
ncbi:Por secretion system C-terminal sorting domain-containing protein [Chitinophaga costaii]|uniref:Por secretion system C-terminal sorting domain-containing protein n=1 Tax=Chitinophaga costaii TaxID=1335309 RepID=A0A1C4F8R4_9BACT|nr:type IX secretion system sortase PorU [Chitinophaga costaii]SCC52387.1 Por secretion system C-terminal sorting domain-containing protein [Chitinophaga costaii]